MDPSSVFLAANLVTHAALEEASVASAPSPLVLPLPEGSGSSLVYGPVLSGVGIKTGSLPLGIVHGVLKGLLVILSISLMKEGQSVVRGLGVKNVIGFGIDPSGSVGSSRIRSAIGSSDLVCTTSIRTSH